MAEANGWFRSPDMKSRTTRTSTASSPKQPARCSIAMSACSRALRAAILGAVRQQDGRGQAEVDDVDAVYPIYSTRNGAAAQPAHHAPFRGEQLGRRPSAGRRNRAAAARTPVDRHNPQIL